MRLNGRVAKLEARLAAPRTGPDDSDAETVELWAGPWIGLGHSVAAAKATALEFLLYCQALGQTPTFYALVRWTQREDEGDGGK